MEDQMGYRNTSAVTALAATRLTYTSRGSAVMNTHAFATLKFMAENTYDFPPTDKRRMNYVPSRLYELGLDKIADMFGYGILSMEELQEVERGGVEAKKRQRKASGIRVIQNDIKFLKEHGLIKMLRPARMNKYNASYLLLLGDDMENYQCELWAQTCIENGWKRR